MEYKEVYESWLANPYFDEATKQELLSIKDDENEIKERFYADLEFGTAGLRGVIGAGTMGSGIAQAFAQTEGYEVCLCDINEEFAANGKAKIAKGLEKRVARGKMEQAAADAILAKITTGVKDICTD